MCWILSNVAAGVESQVKQFMAEKELLDKIASLFLTDVIAVRKEICWIYSNFGHLGDREALINLCLQYDIMRAFANLLHEEDAFVLESVLGTLFKLLTVGKKCEVNGKNLLLVELMNNGGASRLESLQNHPNKTQVYDNVVKILTKFFEMEDETI